MTFYYQDKWITIHHGDCREVMKELADCSIDSVVTDPPYELGFMGKGWDKTGIAYDVEVWRECLRVLKPGGHLLAFGGSRTYHRLACAIEDAGFEIRDQIQWIYAQGFPKSLDVSKAIDAAASRTSGAVAELKDELRRVFDLSGLTLALLNNRCGFEASGYLRKSSTWASVLPSADKWWKMRDVIGCDDLLSFEFKEIEREIIGVNSWTNSANHFVPGKDHALRVQLNITAPSTDAAKQWNGWGTALKPAHEPIVVARKPLIGTVAENVQKYGTGGLNIDGCRIGVETLPAVSGSASAGGLLQQRASSFGEAETPERIGRWPANVIHDGSDEALAGFPNTESRTLSTYRPEPNYKNQVYGKGMGGLMTPDNCYSDSGSAARFFYCAKADKADRNEGLEYMPMRSAGECLERAEGSAGPKHARAGANHGGSRNFHPTVKPTDLMRYLVRLVTPPNGITLDPFCGSGSTGKAAALEEFRSILIDLDAWHCELAANRAPLVQESFFSQ